MGSRKMRRMAAEKNKEKVNCPETDEKVRLNEKVSLIERAADDLTRLPDDTITRIFSCMCYRDRSSFSSTCNTLWGLGKSPCLWKELDLRFHKFDSTIAASLAPRCRNLQKIRFRGVESAYAVGDLQAKNLREISGDQCRGITDAALSALVAQQSVLESLHIGPSPCKRIRGSALKTIAVSCNKLQKLWLSGIRFVDAAAINILALHCRNLTDIGFIDCRSVDVTALGHVMTVRFLSVAGTTNIEWTEVSQLWSRLPNLVALDVSRTDITPSTVSRMFASSRSLKVLCALDCRLLEWDPRFVVYHKGKVLLAVFTNVLKGVAALFNESPKNIENVFLDRGRYKVQNAGINEILNWLEWVLSYSLLRISEGNPYAHDNFWLNQGTNLLLSFLQSPEEEVQERAAAAFAAFLVVDEQSARIDSRKADAVVKGGGIRLLLNLAQSWREGLQSVAAKAIANLSLNIGVTKAVADEGGVSILVNLLRSMNRVVAEEAAGGLWNISASEDHKDVIAEAAGIKSLVDCLFKWSTSRDGEGVLERATGALANLAAYDKYYMEIASAGGVRAFVFLAQNCSIEVVQEQACRALSNMAAYSDAYASNATIGQEAGAIDALVRLTYSYHDGVRQEAAGALWNLSFNERNREAITAAGGVDALVALANSCTLASRYLHMMAGGPLWDLFVSEANRCIK